MKKIISLILVFVFVFAFSSCGKDKKEENNGTVDIEYYAKLGQMPESNYYLGTDPEKIKTELSALSESEDAGDMVYNVTEGENNVLIDNGVLCYYYKKATPEKGIGCIVNYGKAYGFELGTVIVEIKEAIAGCDYVEEPMNESNSFFMFGVESGTVLRCNIEENTVVFVFQDNALCATAIFTGTDW